MEAVVGLLVLVVLLSWIIVLVSRMAIVHEGKHNLALAQVHAEHVINQLKSKPWEQIVYEISRGDWNFPGKPAVMAMGLGALPNESVMTEIHGENPRGIKVAVRWLDVDGQFKEEAKEIKINP